MTSDIRKRYFDWMCSLIYGKYSPRRSYNKLLRLLHDIDFYYILEMDGNRESDGIDLRYRFGYENGYDNSEIASMLDTRPCTVLEMLIALSNRCEESIMGNDKLGDRTGKWFWDMLDNLGLLEYSDGHFNDESVYQIVDRFLSRQYERDGTGGLFTIKGERKDMRGVEIWAQMCWYLNKVL